MSEHHRTGGAFLARSGSLLHADHRQMDLHLAYIRQGQPYGGVAGGPDALMQSGLTPLLSEAGMTVGAQKVYSDDPDGSSHSTGLDQAMEHLAHGVEVSLKNGHFSLTLGGDHAIAFGSIEGALRARPDMRILYIDAHADLNTPKTSPTGNLHGMPLAAHLKLFDPQSLPASRAVTGLLRPEQLGFIGLRDIDPAEKDFLSDLGITWFSSDDVRTHGMTAVLARTLHALDPDGTHPIYVSFDIDSMDPAFAPATGTPVPGGLTPDDLKALADGLYTCGRVTGLDVVEINPDRAADATGVARTVAQAHNLIGTLLGGPAIGERALAGPGFEATAPMRDGQLSAGQ